MLDVFGGPSRPRLWRSGLLLYKYGDDNANERSRITGKLEQSIVQHVYWWPVFFSKRRKEIGVPRTFNATTQV